MSDLRSERDGALAQVVMTVVDRLQDRGALPLCGTADLAEVVGRAAEETNLSVADVLREICSLLRTNALGAFLRCDRYGVRVGTHAAWCQDNTDCNELACRDPDLPQPDTDDR